MSNKARVHTGMKGRYRLSAGTYSEDGEFSPRVVTGWFDNLITNIGMDAMASERYMTYCYVGSSSTTPQNGDTNMGAIIASSSSTSFTDVSAQQVEPYAVTRIRTVEFAQGQAAGNISEVGMGWASSPANALFSRALVLDTQGNPTTITVLENEFLQVTYELVSNINITPFTGSITLGGTVYGYTMQPLGVTSSATTTGWGISSTGTYSSEGSTSFMRAYDNNTIAAVTDTSPSGSSDSADSYTALGYTAGDHYQDLQCTWGLNSANFTNGIGALRVPFGWTSWGIYFDSLVPKTDQNTFTVTVRYSWGRA